MPVLAALGTAIARHWQDAPPLTRDIAVTRLASRFQGLRWATAGDSHIWRGELLWRHPHPVIAGAPCTTHLVLSEQPGYTSLALRVTADDGYVSVRGNVGAGQARPAFLSEINQSLRLVSDGGSADAQPLEGNGIDEFVREVLLSEHREHPVAVLSPLEDGSYVVPPADLADELLGLAALHVIDHHPATFRLSDALGDRRLSCYWGALRVYLPTFSCADRPEDHPLIVRERLDDPVIRAGLVGKLAHFARGRVRMPVGVIEREAVDPHEEPLAVPVPNARTHEDGVNRRASEPVPPAALARETAGPSELSGTGLAATVAPPLAGLGAQIDALAAIISQLVDANDDLTDEVERLRTTTAVRAASTTSLERRIVGLEKLLKLSLAPADQPAPQPDDAAAESLEHQADADEYEELSLRDVLRQAATAHSDALLILDDAERAASESPYEDVDRVAVILDVMAVIARRRQDGGLGTSLREAFRDIGIDYRGAISSTTSEKHRQQYLVTGGDGQLFDCREHIVLGTSYDPRYCLRIYFTSKASVEPRFVIGHVGRHFNVATTT